MDQLVPAEHISQANKNMRGFIKIWKIHKKTGKSELVVNKDNLILYMGAQVLSYALSGQIGYNINYFYIGFNNTDSFVYPTIDLAYSQPFSGFVSPFGYLREPLAFSPSYLSDPNYTNNTSVYTVQIASATSFGGASFTPGTSNIYECALVAAPDPANAPSDLVFSRVNFNQITYDSNFSLSISWGIKFICS
jgi:hypothetical protein